MNESDKQTALVPVQPAALTEVGAKSLAARGRADLRIREEAEEWLKKGLEFHRQQQYEDAFRCFERGIQLDPNHPELQFRLGESFDNSWSIQEDERKSVHWMRKAAEQGHVEAQFWLGWMYFCCDYGDEPGDTNQYGLPYDMVEATRWWRKAAEQGQASAQEMLGQTYCEGVGVRKDFAQAAFWLGKAAEQGERYAQCELGDLYAHGQGVTQDYEQAEIWYRKAAEQGYESAQMALEALEAMRQRGKDTNPSDGEFPKLSEHEQTAVWKEVLQTHPELLKEQDSVKPTATNESDWRSEKLSKEQREVSIRGLEQSLPSLQIPPEE
jgi:TPR repeat protein